MSTPATTAIMRPGRVKARQADLHQFVQDKGTFVDWEESILCPCVDLTTRSPDPNHDLCRLNYGRLYFPKRQVRILITNQDWAKNFLRGFPATTGTTSFTFPNYRTDKATKEESIGESSYPADGDRLTLAEEQVCISDEILTTGKMTKTGMSLEVSRFRKITELMKVVKLSPDRSSMVEQVVGVDVTVVPDSRGDMRQINWLTPQLDGTQYSIRYLTNPEFIVKEIEPRFKRAKEGPLPPFVRAYRLDYLAAAT